MTSMVGTHKSQAIREDLQSQMGNQVKSKHPSLTEVQTSRPLELLHIDLMGLARVQSLGGMKYILVVVDDFTRYTQVVLLRDKDKAPKKMIHLCKKLQVKKGFCDSQNQK